jgi:hypothetical protein
MIKSNKYHLLIIIFFGFSFFSYLFGCLTYAIIRPRNTLMFNWFEHLNVSTIIGSFRENTIINHIEFPQWLIYSFPDASWVLFGTCIIAFIWGFRYSNWIFFFPCVGILSELLQFFRLLPGTFDPIDMILLLLASFFPIFIIHLINIKTNTNNHEN